MNLIIVESPTKARTLNRFLGKDYSVEATMGHIKDLPKSKLGVDVENNFEPDYVRVDKRKKEIKKIKDLAKKADGIYLASDPDREGEAIAAHVQEEISSQKTIDKNKIKRISFHEITKSAVEEAISHPHEIDFALVDAQIARRVLDRLVGYKLSPLLWKKVRRGLSAGRVQTVAVRLIVERQREIEAFNPVEYWIISADLKKDNQQFVAELKKIDGKKAEIGNKSEAGKIVSDLEKSDYQISEIQRREVRKRPWAPLITSTMTRSAASIMGWSSKKTMTVAQRLYEEGLITYHRTDSTNLSKSAVSQARSLIKSEYGSNYLPEQPRIYKTKSKGAQEAHEAIRPTDSTVTPKGEWPIKGSFATDTTKLYDLIWKRFIASQMSDTVYDRTSIIVEAKVDKVYELRVSGQIVKFDGWRKLFGLSSDDDPQLPEVEKGDNLELKKVSSEQKFTTPPPAYNEASLIKMLESLGIGRPSTYAPTISTIQDRNYVEKTDGKFAPTTVGIAVADFLVKHFNEVFEYGFTAEMENDLDRVATGQKDWRKILSEFWGPFVKKLETTEEKAQRVKIEYEKLGKKCPECKEGELVVRIGRFGKFISCDRFPDCKYTDKYVDKIGMKCPDCKKGDVIVKKTKKGRQFYGCSRYPKCEYASWKDPRQKDKENEKEK